MSGTNIPNQQTNRTRPKFPVSRGLFQTKAALTAAPLFMMLCGCLSCGVTAVAMSQAGNDPDVGGYWGAALCCTGGLSVAAYGAFIVGYGKLYNKAIDEGIEREAEVYRRGFRE